MQKTRKNVRILILLLSVLLMLISGIVVSIAVVTATGNGSDSESARLSPEEAMRDIDADRDVIITPDAVSEFETVKASADSVTLKWRRSPFTTSYIVYRSQEKSDGTMSGYKKLRKTSLNYFEDKNVDQARAYDYRIAATRVVGGRSTESKAISATVLTKPDAVTGLKTVAKTDTAVKLRWSKNSAASNYVVFRSRENSDGSFGKYKKVLTVPSGLLTYTDRGLASGTAYRYKVKAQKVMGDMSSLGSSKSTGVVTDLGAVKKFVVKRVAPTKIKLAWSRFKNADGYELYRGKKLIAATDKTVFTDKKLKSATGYNYSVRAVRTYNSRKFTGTFRKVVTRTTADVSGTEKGMSGTWVEVSIPEQTLYLYVGGELRLTTPVVTGNYGELSTETGFHKVLNMSSPSQLKGSYNGSSWDVKVNYWIGFTYYGQGIHDSTWRSGYGGTIYMGDGSHGCVNTPLDAMAEVYSKAYVGMPVVIY